MSPGRHLRPSSCLEEPLERCHLQSKAQRLWAEQATIFSNCIVLCFLTICFLRHKLRYIATMRHKKTCCCVNALVSARHYLLESWLSAVPQACYLQRSLHQPVASAWCSPGAWIAANVINTCCSEPHMLTTSKISSSFTLKWFAAASLEHEHSMASVYSRHRQCGGTWQEILHRTQPHHELSACLLSDDLHNKNKSGLEKAEFDTLKFPFNSNSTEVSLHQAFIFIQILNLRKWCKWHVTLRWCICREGQLLPPIAIGLWQISFQNSQELRGSLHQPSPSCRLASGRCSSRGPWKLARIVNRRFHAEPPQQEGLSYILSRRQISFRSSLSWGCGIGGFFRCHSFAWDDAWKLKMPAEFENWERSLKMPALQDYTIKTACVLETCR